MVYNMTSSFSSTTLPLHELLANWHEMQDDWQIILGQDNDDNDNDKSVYQQTVQLQQLLQQHGVYSARWKWIPPPFYTHWTAWQRAAYLHVTTAKRLVRTAVLENCCVVSDVDPSYPRFCVVVWPCTATLNLPRVVQALQGLRAGDQRVANHHYDLQWALPDDVARRLRGGTTAEVAQWACPLLATNTTNTTNTVVILAKSVLALRYFWVDAGHGQAKVGLTVTDFVRVVQPIVAAIDEPQPALEDPHATASVLDAIPHELQKRSHDGVDVEAIRLQALSQGLPRLAADADPTFRPPHRRIPKPLHVWPQPNNVSRPLPRDPQRIPREKGATVVVQVVGRQKPPVPRFLVSPSSRLLQPTVSYVAHLHNDPPNGDGMNVALSARQAPGQPTTRTTTTTRRQRKQQQCRRTVPRYERSTVSSQRGRSVPPRPTTTTTTTFPTSAKERAWKSSSTTPTPPRPTTTTTRQGQRFRGRSAPARSSSNTDMDKQQNRRWRAINDSSFAKKEEESIETPEEEANDELIGSVENDNDDFFMMSGDDMMLDDLLSDDGEIVFDEFDSSSGLGAAKPENHKTSATTTTNVGSPKKTPDDAWSQNSSTHSSLSPKKEMQTEVVSELYKKLTAIPVPPEQEMHDLFHQIDRQGLGTLRLRNVETAIVQRKFDLPPTVVLRAFQTADTNQDGAIGRQEFFQFVRCITYFENLMQLFMEMDVDSDRRLDKQEFLKAADVLEVKDPEAVFGEMNGDRSGYVVFDQFCLWMAEKRALENVTSWASTTPATTTTTTTFSNQAEASVPHKLGLTDSGDAANETSPPEHIIEDSLEAETISAVEEIQSGSPTQLLATAALDARGEEDRVEAARVEEAQRVEEEHIATKNATHANAEAKTCRYEEERVSVKKGAAEARPVGEAPIVADMATTEARYLEEERIAAENSATEAPRLDSKSFVAEKVEAEEKVEQIAELIAKVNTSDETETKLREQQPIARKKPMEVPILGNEDVSVEAKLLDNEQRAAETKIIEEGDSGESTEAMSTPQESAGKILISDEPEKVHESLSMESMHLAERTAFLPQEISTETENGVDHTDPIEAETPLKGEKAADTTLDTEVSFFSTDDLSPIKNDNEFCASVVSQVAISTSTDEELAVSSGRVTPVVSSESVATKAVAKNNSNQEVAHEELKTIMDRRRKMEEEGVVRYDSAPKRFAPQSTLDTEVQAKLDKRRSLSDDGIFLAGNGERRASTRDGAVDAEVQSKLDRRRCLSDDGVNLMKEVERRATTKREKLKSFGMSSDLQAIMARRRQAADTETQES